MRGVLPSLLAGTLAGLGLFGLLAAIEPDLPPAEDVWRIGWEEAGLDVQFREGRPGDEGGLLLRRLEDLFEAPAYEGTKVRRYDVNLIRTEVIWLPDESLLEEIPEGRHLKFRLGKSRRRAHLCRSGRYLVLVSTGVRVALNMFPSSPETVERMFDVFEERAEELQRR